MPAQPPAIGEGDHIMCHPYILTPTDAMVATTTGKGRRGSRRPAVAGARYPAGAWQQNPSGSPPHQGFCETQEVVWITRDTPGPQGHANMGCPAARPATWPSTRGCTSFARRARPTG